MILKKQFDEITFIDIEELIANKVSESQLLEYKTQPWTSSKKMLKHISAMGNAQGGLIIIDNVI